MLNHVIIIIITTEQLFSPPSEMPIQMLNRKVETKIFIYFTTIICLLISCEYFNQKSTFIVHRESIAPIIPFEGKISDCQITYFSFAHDRYIEKVFVNSGQSVLERDTLLIVNNRESLGRFVQKKNALYSSQIDLRTLETTQKNLLIEELNLLRNKEIILKKEFDKAMLLYRQGAVAQSEVEKIEQQLTNLKSQFKLTEQKLSDLQENQKQILQSQANNAQIDFEQAQFDVSEKVLRAPTDGKIVEIEVSKGEFIKAGVKIISFLPKDSLVPIDISIGEFELYNIKPGRKINLQIPANSRQVYESHVKQISPIINATSGKGTIRIYLQLQNENFFIGSSIIGTLFLDTIHNVYTIPIDFHSIDTSRMYIVNKNGDKLNKYIRAVNTINKHTILWGDIQEGDKVHCR